MRNLTKPCLCFIITLLEIAVLVLAADYGAPRSFGGSRTPVEISSQDITKNQAIPPQNFLQTPSNLAPNSYNKVENPRRNTREVFAENLASNFNPQVDNNRIEENSGRNVREILDTGSRVDIHSMFDTEISNEGTCQKENPVRNTREVFDTEPGFDTNDSDTGSVFDTNVSSDDTKQDTCLEENIDNRYSREVPRKPGSEIDVINSNILKSIGDDCHEENLKRNARQVIGTSSLIGSSNLNQNIQESENEIQEESESFNKLKKEEILESNRKIREVLVPKGSLEDAPKLTNSQNDIPLISNKLEIYPSIISETSLDGDQNFEGESNRNVREVGDSQQSLNKNLEEVESKNRNAREVDDKSAFEGIVDQNSNDERLNENSQRVVRDVHNASPIGTDSVENLRNRGENQGFERDNLRNGRSLDDKNPMIGSDLSSLDKLKEDGNLKEMLTSPQDMIKSNLIKDSQGLEGNVRNTREIIGDPGLDLETNFKKGNQDSDGDEYLGIPSNYASNSDENLEENLERKAREVQGPFLSNSDGVLGENMNENNAEGSVENGRTIKGGAQKNVRDTENPSLIGSDVFNQNSNKNEDENIENRGRVERGASNESEDEEKSDKRGVREISDERGILESKFSRQNFENLDLNSENLEDSPGILDPTLFTDDESLVGDNMRNIRDVSDKELVENESKMEGKYMNFEREVDGDNMRNIRDVSDRELVENESKMEGKYMNFEREVEGDNMKNIRDVSDRELVENESKMGGKYMHFEREVDEIQNGIQDMEPSLSNQENTDVHRNARETPDLSREMNLELSSDEMVEEKRNAREIPNSNRELDLEIYEGDDDDDIGNNRNVRHVSEGFGTNFPNVLSAQTGGNLRNIQGISAENSNIASNPFDQGVISDKSRNTQETPVVNPSFTQNSLNQGSNFEEPLNIREIFFKNPGFNPGYFQAGTGYYWGE
ncbi:probable serine/threonine-protein kinase DDB_G0282963 [Nilaparvata lugens]|uniref:probable serine/threonine-protein kinase DDB_G0282963 n=1 Tax=Nilaparvata lugens TaxID=108931 RepID=UPI00193DF7C7|nr:probable serine/threonine-protein kinase DDB_G0282963 [Nilaparvata lugens]